MNSPAALASTAKVSISAGGSFSFNAANDAQTFSTPLELAGNGNGSGAFFTYVEGSSLTWSGPINLLGTTTLEAYAANSTVNLTGAIGDLAGNSDVTFFTSGAGTTHKDYFVLSGASSYGGNTILNNYAANCEVKLSGGANRLPVTTALYLSSGQWNPVMVSALDLNGNSQTVAGLADGTYTSGSRRIVNTSATAATFTVSNSVSFIFGGTLGGNDLAGVAGNNFAFVKSGPGQLILNGAAQHTGTTTVNGGALLVNASLNPSVLTATAATLGGTGFVRAATLNAGCTLKPGTAAGAGTLTLSNLTCAAGCTLSFDLTNALTVGGGVNDFVFATNISFTGVTAVSISPLAPLAAGRYVLLRASSALSGAANLSLLPPLAGSRYQPALDFSVANEIGLIITNGSAARNLTWKGSPTNSIWDFAATTNWQNGGASSDVFYNADSVTFDDSGISSNSLLLAGSLAPAALTMNSASNYTFSGSGNLTGPVNPVMSGSGTWTIANTNNFKGGTLAIQSGIVNLNYNSSSTGPELTGLGSAVVSSGAMLNIAHPNSASPVNFANVPLTLSGVGPGSYNGALKFANGLALSSVWPGAITLAGATTIHTYGVTITTRLNGVINGSGPLTLAARGGNSASHTSTYYLGAQNNYSGDTTVQNNDGLLEIAVRAATNNVLPPNSALAFGSAGGGAYTTFDLNGFNQQVAGIYTNAGSAVMRIINSSATPATLTVSNNADYVFSGRLGDASATNFSLTKAGSGGLTLNGSNTFSGNVIISAGTLKLGHVRALGATNNSIVITNAGTLDLAGFSAVTNNPVSVSGTGNDGNDAITSTAQISTPFVGLCYVTLTGDAVFSTPTRWDIGTTTTGGTLVGGGHKLTLTGTNAMSLNYLGETDLGDLVVSNSILYVQGTTTTLGRPTNSVYVYPGSSLNLWGSGINITKPLVLNGGTLANGSGNATYSGPVTLNANSLVSAVGTFTLSGTISGAAGFTNSAVKLVLTGTNSYQGGTFINSGTVNLNSDAALGAPAGGINFLGTAVLQAGAAAVTLNPSRNVALNTGATATVDCQANQLAINGVISGGGALNKIGTGTLTLAGANNYSGPTAVTAGKLILNGVLGTNILTVTNATLGGSGTICGPVTIQNGGTLAPGSSGVSVLTISNNLTLNSGSATILQINRSAGTNDALTGLNTVTFAGTLLVTNLGGTFAAGDTFKLFSAANYAGIFSSVTLPALSLGLAWTNQLATRGTIAVYSTIPATPPTLFFSPTNGSSLVISWPTNYVGYYLQCQTGSLTVGLTTNWFPVAGGSNPPFIAPLIRSNPSIFFRLTH